MAGDQNYSNGIGGTGGGTASTVVSIGGSGSGLFQPIRQAPTNLSFIETHEEAEAARMLDEEFKSLTKSDEFPDGVTFREHARITRYFAAIKIYVRPEELKTVTDVLTGEKKTIYLPDSVRAEDKYQSCVGLIVGLGPDAFMAKDGTPRGSSYKVGDWVVFVRPDIIRVDFCNIPIGLLTDDRSLIVTDDPRFWTAGTLKYKV